jgi:hypothetical protein
VDILTDEQKLELLESLVRRTRRGDLEWDVASDDGSGFSFSVRTSRFGYRIDCIDKDDNPPFVVRFGKLEEPRQIHSFDTRTLNPRLNRHATQLYETVKRRVFHLDVLADEVLADLAEDEASD